MVFDENEVFMCFQVLLSTDSIPTGPAGYKLPSAAVRVEEETPPEAVGARPGSRHNDLPLLGAHTTAKQCRGVDTGDTMQKIKAIPEAIQRGGRSPWERHHRVQRGNKGGLKTPIGRCDDGSNTLLG